jgi:sugar lactone lactonase YvrE
MSGSRNLRLLDRALLPALALLPATLAPAAEAPFVRGNADATGSLTITDSILVLNYLFRGGPAPPCIDAADADDDGTLVITDPLLVLNYLFNHGEAPALPFPACGVDPTADDLGCAKFEPCARSEFEDLVESFGLLETIAGKGQTGDDTNDWNPSFEGGPAVEAELSTPHNALGDDAGNIYIADKDSHAIRKVTTDGRIVTVAGTNVAGNGTDDPALGTETPIDQPNGLWVRGDGTVYILDLGNQKIRRLAPDGQMRTLFVVPGLSLGRGLWVAADESLAYVASGSTLYQWLPTRPDPLQPFSEGFIQLGNIAVNREGEVFATDRGAHRVFKLSSTGQRTVVAGNGTRSGGGDGQAGLDTGLDEVRGIWLLDGGGMFLATHRGSQVWYLDTSGIIHLFLDGAPDAHAGDGEPFNAPPPRARVSEVRNVTMDRAGNLLVIEHDFGFVRRVRRTGT